MMTVNFFVSPFGIESSHCIFSLKTHKMFSVHTTLEKFEKVTIMSQFGFASEEKLERKIRSTQLTSSFSKRFQILPVCNIN